MKNLSLWLPPFAADYSGACSVLFDLKALSVLIDASCCTRNYTGFDEPRWIKETTPMFCAQLRSIEATLGDERRIIEDCCEAAEKLKPPFVALMGSPVPAITGMDVKGLACVIEERTNIPAIGIDTTGFDTYEVGASKAMKQIIERFAKPAICSTHITEAHPHINILGLTPIDFGNTGNASAIKGLFEDGGYEVILNGAMDYSLENLHACSSADANVVVSWSGLAAARFLEQKFGTPYMVGIPTAESFEHFNEILISTIGRSINFEFSHIEQAKGCDNNESTLFLCEQVLGNSLRYLLRLWGYKGDIFVASFFGWEKAWAQEGDVHLSDEASLVEFIQSGHFNKIVGDPLFSELPCASDIEFIALPHPAVSSLLHWDEVPIFTQFKPSDFNL